MDDKLVEEYVLGYIVAPSLEAFKEDIELQDNHKDIREFCYPLIYKDKSYIAQFGTVRFLMEYMKFGIYATFVGGGNSLYLYYKEKEGN